MKIEGNTIFLKSDAYNFYKEKDGRKSNTARQFLKWEEHKEFENFRNKKKKTKIRIIESSGTEGFFEREISDITFYNGMYIISWRP